MLTAEAEKRVYEIAKDVAEKAVLDHQSIDAKQTNLSGNVAQLEGEVQSLVLSSEVLVRLVANLEYAVKNLQKEVDDLK